MKRTCSALLVLPLLWIPWTAGAQESVEWSPERTFKLEESPVDVAYSNEGRWIFVLCDDGSLLVYTAEGRLADKISVGTHVSSIKAGPREHIVLLVSKQNKTVEEIALEFVYEIDTAGSPFKGKEDAPVVIALFNDYQ